MHATGECRPREQCTGHDPNASQRQTAPYVPEGRHFGGQQVERLFIHLLQQRHLPAVSEGQVGGAEAVGIRCVDSAVTCNTN